MYRSSLLYGSYETAPVLSILNSLFVYTSIQLTLSLSSLISPIALYVFEDWNILIFYILASSHQVSDN